MTHPASHGRIRALLIAGGSAALVAIVLAFVAPAAFFPAYLAVACGWIALPLGCVALLAVTHLIGGPWTDFVRRPLAIGAATMPVAGLILLPVLGGMAWIYPWSGGIVQAEVPWFRALWLAPGFFVLRTLLYLVVMSAAAFGLARGSAPAAGIRIACATLLAWAALGTVTGVDWMLSVEARFHSSIFGLMVMSQQILAGVALAALAGRGSPRKSGIGGIFIAAILFWAYLHAMQFIIIWTGNIPTEVEWYLHRGAGVWAFVAGILGLVQFLAIFGLLLLSPVRRSQGWLAGIALVTILMRPLETAWLTLPAFDAQGLATAASALVCWVAIGCLWTAAFRFAAGRVPVPSPTA